MDWLCVAVLAGPLLHNGTVTGANLHAAYHGESEWRSGTSDRQRAGSGLRGRGRRFFCGRFERGMELITVQS